MQTIDPRPRRGLPPGTPADPSPGMPLPPMPPPPANVPLALANRIGTRAAVGSGAAVGTTGPGTPIFGGMTGFGGGFEQMLGGDEMLRRIVAGLGVKQ